MVDDPFLSNESDFAVPVASNKNKQLEAEYLENLKKCGVINLELREADEEINDLSNTVKALRNELDCNQIFANIRKNELETENNLLKMSRRERSKISEMMLGLDKQMKLVIEKQAYIKTFIEQTQMKIDDKKREMTQNEKDLSDWLTEVQTKEEEEYIYANYTNLDQSKIKDLLIQVSLLNDVYMERKKKLDKENTEICALKFFLSKTIEETNRHHHERMEHIERLQKVVELIAYKEVNINLLFKTIRNLKQEMKEKMEFRKEREALLLSSTANNQELTKRLINIGNYKIRLKADLRDMNLKLTALKNEYKGLRITLDRTVVDLEISRSTVNRLKKDILEIVERLKHAACDVYNLVTERENVEREMEEKLERGKKLLRIIREDEGMRMRAEAELKELTKFHYSRTQELKNLMDQKKAILTDIAISKTSFMKMDDEMDKINQTGVQQMMFFFVKELMAQTMARKIKNLEGHMLVVEQNELLTQIKEKSAILEECDKALLFWSSQSRNVKGILHRKRYEHEKIMTLKKDVSERHKELTTQIKISGKLLEGLYTEKKEQFIARSMLQLTIERLRSVLIKEAGGVMTLDKIKESLDFEMKAKMLEMEANKNQINSQMQIVKTKHHELKLEISDKRFKSQQLIKKYEVLTTFMKSSNENVEGNSTIHFIMRSIQEKEELKMRGNKLNAEVSKGELELKGMQNAAALIQCKNQVRVKKVTDSDKESLELKQLESKMATLLKDINIVKREIKDSNDEATKMKTQIDECIMKHQYNFRLFRATEELWNKAKNEAEKQVLKCDRSLKAFQISYKNATHSSNQQILKKLLEIELLILEKSNELALQQFFKVMHRNEELSEFATNKFEEMGLIMASKLLTVFKTSRSASSLSHFKIGVSRSKSRYTTQDGGGHHESTQSMFIPKERIFKSTRHMVRDASLIDPRSDMNLDMSTYIVRAETDKPGVTRDDAVNM